MNQQHDAPPSRIIPTDAATATITCVAARCSAATATRARRIRDAREESSSRGEPRGDGQRGASRRRDRRAPAAQALADIADTTRACTRCARSAFMRRWTRPARLP